MSGFDFEEVTSKKPHKSLTVSLKKNSGRNSNGRITSFRKAAVTRDATE